MTVFLVILNAFFGALNVACFVAYDSWPNLFIGLFNFALITILISTEA